MLLIELPGNTTHSSYGTSLCAFIIDEYTVFIYSPSEKRQVYKKRFRKQFQAQRCQFTSILLIDEKVFAGVSDGRILYFPRDKATKNYSQARPQRFPYLLPNGDLRGITLIGGSPKVLIYQIEQQITFAFPKHQSHRIATENRMTAHLFDREKDRFWFTTNTDDNAYINFCRVDLLPDQIAHIKLRVPKSGEKLPVAISKNGDLAVSLEGLFLISRPFANMPQLEEFSIGNSTETSSDHDECCFVGEDHEYFIYSGGKGPELGEAYLDFDKRWKYKGNSLDSNDFEETCGEDFVGNDGSSLKGLGFNSQNLIIGVKGPQKDSLLMFGTVDKDGLVFDC